MTRIFLARTEEQKRFREVLRSLQPNVGWLSENLPTVAKFLPAKKETVSTSPHIFLLYGEGGMGKTSLGRRFYELAGEEFPNCFQVLRLDWEEAKNDYPSLLNVGHESIRPESMLETIYHLMVSEGHKGAFNEYRQVEKTLKEIENKVDKAVQAQQGNSPLARIGKIALGLLLAKLQMDSKVEELLGVKDSKKTEELTNLVADESINALAGLMKKHLDLKERKIYAKPHRQLAEALGHGLQAISAQKPLVLLLDTYEIVDRLECDRVLRMVIKAAGRRVVWAIAGRANLADSYRLLQGNFLGYRNEFSENLYVYPMSEFSQEQVIEYFAHPEINVLLNDVEAESVKQFSLGIPYVVQLIAEMRQEGIDLATILGDPSDDRENESPSEKVIRMTSDRFLRYCMRGSTDEKAIYAMAMMRRPNNDILQAMLGVTDLESEMRSLKARHSFVVLEGKYIKLHNNLNGFLQDYLRSGLAGQSPMVQDLSDRAVAYLELRLSEWTQEFTDTADYFESDRIANGLLDLVQFKFWQDVEVGWRYAVPLFVESWQYNRDWQKQLSGVIEAFQVRFDGDSKKRLRIFTKGIGYYFNSIHYIFNADSETALLNELETLTRRGWLDGERKSQYITILTLQRGRFLSRLGKYSESLQIYLELEQKLSETALHLRKALATEYRNIGDQLTWIDDRIVFSTQAQIAYQHAVELNKEDSNAWYGLGTSLALEGENESATEAFKKATQLDPKFASPYNGLGNVYLSQDKFDLAIQSYQKAIELDPKSIFTSSPCNGLGNTYQAQGNYESAIKFYTMAIELDPQFALPYNGLGVVYQAQNNYEDAITYYWKAISLDSKFPYARLNLGFISWLQDKRDDAISLWKEGLALLLIDENSEYRQYAKFVCAWHKFLIGETYDAINSLREILQTEKLPVSLMSDILKDAETISRLSTKLEGIDTVIKMLCQAIEKAQ